MLTRSMPTLFEESNAANTKRARATVDVTTKL